MAGEERALRRITRQPFERDHAVIGRHLADRVHAKVQVELGQALAKLVNLGDALPDLGANDIERVSGHGALH